MKKILAMVLALCLMLSGCVLVPDAVEEEPVSNTKPAQISITPTKHTLRTPKSYKEVYKLFESDVVYEESTGGMGAMNDGAMMETPMAAPEADMEMPAEDAVESVEKGDYSTTNNQTEGVDEGDIVKTDGKYIYHYDGSELRIVEAKGADSQVISKTVINVDEDEHSLYYNDIYIDGGYLIAVGNEYKTEDGNYNNFAAIALYDVSDPANVKLVNTFNQSGYTHSTRLVGDVLYIITNFYAYSVDEDMPITYIPRVCINGADELVAVGDLCIPEDSNDNGWLTVSAYDIVNQKVISTKSMLGRADTVYMSGSNIYVANSEWKNEESESYTVDQYTVTDHVESSQTNIHKFSFDNGDINYECSGVVVGNLLNQFSMDEYNGNLRVVTTDNSYSYHIYVDEKYGFENYEGDSDSESNGLYVLDENLEVIGSIDKLADDEVVYSVRFDGKTGYFVTFRQTDPLFSVDLSNPAKPKILGELKINGFSKYLHTWGSGKLIGIGMDADDEGSVGNMKLSLFDVSNPKNVKESVKTVLPYSYSEALYNHHAVFADVERGLLGFSVEGGYALYTVGDDGFTEFAVIDGIVADYSIRGVRIDETMYIISSEGITIVDLANAGAVLATVDFGARG